ncbi:transcobalamin-1 isoform X2 [Oryctolagus cuniculus]|uniref:transcobalamin-1 isoform X2 n=1 Tax=Oryctolagus cuniculus TaxID=9986 RepID=UPI0038790E00
MRQYHQLPLVGFLLFSLIPSQLCKTCEVTEENDVHLNSLLSTMTTSKYTSGTQSANVLLSLRLVGMQNQTLKQQLSQQVRSSVEMRESNLSSGQLAMIILALGACHTPDETFIYDHHLISHLQNKFQAEIENMGAHDGNPLTNYYQVSLDVLVLCLFNGNYSVTKVADLFSPENKNYYLRGQFSVGTFNISSHVPKSVTTPNPPSNISVNYSVVITKTYSTTVTVPSGSVFLDVMEEAQKINETVFGFTVEKSSWGPYITSVQGLKANNNERTFWEILSGGKPLSQGVGNYVVHDGESLEIHWSKY